jgi:hypothetical protein
MFFYAIWQKMAGSRSLYTPALGLNAAMPSKNPGNSQFTILNSPFCPPFRGKSIEVPLHEPFTRLNDRCQSNPVKAGQGQSRYFYVPCLATMDQFHANSRAHLGTTAVGRNERLALALLRCPW